MTVGSVPFGSPLLVALDSLRLILAVAGAVLAGYQVRLIVRTPAPGQKARLSGIAVCLVVLAASRIQNLGGPLTWQFFGTILAVGLLWWGTAEFGREIPSEPRAQGDPGRHVRPPGAG